MALSQRKRGVFDALRPTRAQLAIDATKPEVSLAPLQKSYSSLSTGKTERKSKEEKWKT
ncbi:MAG: hypothetical protein LBI57_07120 [Helicobacteraceae bacterium]|nr:hypothetical protein [Helicobacteraceae bacterium]